MKYGKIAVALLLSLTMLSAAASVSASALECPASASASATSVSASASDSATLTDGNGLCIAVETVTAEAGSEAVVKFTVSGNEGIALFSLALDYDTAALELKEINGNPLIGGSFTPNIDEDFLLWIDYSGDNAFNGVAFSAVFKVKENAPIGKATVALTLPYESGNILNNAWEDISPTLIAGSVTVTQKRVAGDVNGDKLINDDDVTLLTRFLAGWKNTSVNEINSDVNGDGAVTPLDRAVLARYVAGWQGYDKYFA